MGGCPNPYSCANGVVLEPHVLMFHHTSPRISWSSDQPTSTHSWSSDRPNIYINTLSSL
jgi:hypothetical protein